MKPSYPQRPVSLRLFCVLTLLVFCASSSSSSAQPLDDSKLIDALAADGLDELLLHLAETGDFDNAIEPQLIRIGRLRIASQDPALPAEERLERFDEARRELQALIDDPETNGHPLRPVWRTDLAEMLLTTYLDGFHRSAGLFVEFGVPTNAQRAAFDEAVPLAWRMMEAADTEFRDLENMLGHNQDLRDELERSLVYYRIFDEYRDQKSAWFTARSAYLASLLPDSPEASRSRWWAAAERKLMPMAAGEVGGSALAARAESLLGRIDLQRGDAASAERRLRGVTSNNAELSDNLLAAAVGAWWAAAAQGQTDRAVAGLAELASKSWVRGSLDHRLLVTDAQHRLLLEQAGGDPAAIERAYAVYTDLLDDPSLGVSAGPLRNLIFDRWTSGLAADASAEETAKLPAAVRAAVADLSRRRGLLRLQRGEADAGRAELQRAVSIASTLNDRAAAGDTAWATGRYAAAFATYALNPKELGALLRAAELATDVAEQTPDQPVATDAIDLATKILEPLHRQFAGQAGVTSAFERAMRVLFESGHFDTTPAADDRRVYYAFALYHARGDYERAAAIYARQLPSHPNYFDAQAQRLAALSEALRAADEGAGRSQRAAGLLDTARRLEAAATPVWRTDRDATRSASAARAVAEARLAQAAVLAQRGDIEGALTVVNSFRDEFVDRPEVMRRSLERQIVMLVEADRLDDAQRAAGAMMGRFPDAAAGVINNVLTDFEQRIDRLGGGIAESARLADAAAAMAKLLADWAQGQGLTDDALLPYRLTVLRSLRIADRPDEALAYLNDTGLKRDHPNHLDVLFEHALALIATGDPASIREAAPLLNRILGGLTEPYPTVYWQAWVARLRINLLLNERVAEVPRRVRQLEQRFPDLGGEPFQTQLRTLVSDADRVLGAR